MTNTSQINVDYKSEIINHMEYKIEKLGERKFKISSDYSPYQSFSNCQVTEYSIRLTEKKGVIEREYFSDLGGNQNTIRRTNKVFVSKSELEDIIADINRDLIAYHNDIIENDTMDSFAVEHYKAIERLYNREARF